MLEHSWNLENKINNWQDSELKTLAMRYIELSTGHKGKRQSINNLTYRSNLMYIIEHKGRILQELKDFIAKLEV